MDKPRKHNLTSFGKNVISTISVALVLLILGIVGAMGLATRNITDSIKENLGFDIVMKEDAGEDAINGMKQLLNSSPFLSSYDYMSAETILAQESEYLGADIVEIIGVNPYQPEFNVRLKAAYANVDSIASIRSSLATIREIAEINVHDDMVRDINKNINTISVILVAVAVALLLVSFVLINNTVRLTIYSRRFLIHTMRLVGATGSFIRKPIVTGNMLNGVVAAVIAIGMLAGLRLYAMKVEPDIAVALPLNDMAWIFAGIIAGGIAICGLASIFATNKYLRQKYDKMF